MACKSNLCVSVGGMFLGHPFYLRNEPHREKTGFLPMRKQRRISASLHG